ncbi:hypothetical protein DFO55_10165 [Grimontella sp. AG753]|nr:hypothetical protein DFO55_10165 [Grimontella sp. AG753]
MRRSENVPNYIINGLITTTSVWADGGKVRYDLLGKAMQAAGIDSGMTKTDTAASGYGGQWSELSTDYSNITAAGLLAYRVGYDSAMYSVYLRRDGTLPMTGDLNMGGQSIYNAQNITAAGTTTTGILKTVGEATVGADLTVAGNTQVNGNINAIGGILGGYLKSNNNIEATGNIHSDKTVDAHYFLPNLIEVVGTACPTQGLISKESTGGIISCQNGVWRRINYSADAPKPLKIIMSCQAGNNSSNSCRRDIYIDLTFWRDGISRPEIKLIDQRITRWWGDGCGSCSPGSFTYSNGVIQMGVNQAFVEREFTLSW